MNLLMTLLLAHLFADFPLQTNSLARLKEKRIVGVFLHVLVHVAVTACLLRNSHQYWLLLVGIGAVHFMIDVGKLLCPAPKGVCYFVGDQLLHGFSLFGAAELAHLVWSPAPTGIFPDEWLVIVWRGALVPMLMVLLWVWTNNLSQTGRNNFVLLYSTRHRLLWLEQRVGLTIMAMAFCKPVMYVLVNWLQMIWR